MLNRWCFLILINWLKKIFFNIVWSEFDGQIWTCKHTMALNNNKKKGTHVILYCNLCFYYRASLWLRYGILQSLEMLILTNSIGALLNFFYLILFYYFTSRKVRIHYLYCFRLKKNGDSIFLSLKFFPFNINCTQD